MKKIISCLFWILLFSSVFVCGCTKPGLKHGKTTRLDANGNEINSSDIRGAGYNKSGDFVGVGAEGSGYTALGEHVGIGATGGYDAFGNPVASGKNGGEYDHTGTFLGQITTVDASDLESIKSGDELVTGNIARYLNKIINVDSYIAQANGFYANTGHDTSLSSGGTPRAKAGVSKYGVKDDGSTASSGDSNYGYYFKTTLIESNNTNKGYKYEYKNYKKEKDDLYITGELKAEIENNNPKKIKLSGLLMISSEKYNQSENNNQRKLVRITFGETDSNGNAINHVVLDDHAPKSGIFKLRYQNSTRSNEIPEKKYNLSQLSNLSQEQLIELKTIRLFHIDRSHSRKGSS